MFFRGLVVALLGSLLGSGLLRGEDRQPPVTAGLTLREALRIALDHNSDLRVAQTQVNAALAQLRIAQQFPNPTFGLSTAKINTDRHSNRTTAGNGLLDRSYDSIVSLSQLFEIGKRGPRSDSARAGVSPCLVGRTPPRRPSGAQTAAGCDASTTVWMPPRTSQSVVTVMRRGAIAATRSSRIRLVMSSWKPPSLRKLHR